VADAATVVRPQPTPAGAPARRRVRLIVVVAALLVAALVAALLIVRGRGWQPVWTEDFGGAKGSAPSSQNWLVDTGTRYPGGAAQWGTGELQTYSTDPANLSLDGEGHLRITATRDAAGAWRSGRVETKRADFRPPAGGRLKMEARVQLPNGGPGYWSAFWALGAPYRPAHTDWPGSGEIDVMENLGSEPGTVHGTLHCGIYAGGPCRETLGLGGADATGKTLTGFHTYAVEWDRSKPTEELRWTLDGAVYHTVKATDVDAATWQRATGHGFFLLLNVAIGGGWPGPPTAATKPGASMLVDRVTVSQQG
jgi:beta-glucanase (GH16 family)